MDNRLGKSVIGRQSRQLTTSPIMPKASVQGKGKVIRRSSPLNIKPTVKFKTITRARTSVGRATSKTLKKTEQSAQLPTPTPLPSDLPEVVPMAVIDTGEQEEQEVKVQKGPSRAVSVSFPTHRVGVIQFTSRCRPG